MWTNPKQYDVIVIGAGHAGCEAAYASAKMGNSTLLLTMNLDTIAKMSCNPSIGGIAKGHLVREIDALGGIMGQIADMTGIHFRMLNASKGPAVHSPRAQVDKLEYHYQMKFFLENTENLEIKQSTATELIVENNTIKGIKTQEGIVFLCKTLIITSGTFMKGKLFIGHTTFDGGRSGDTASYGLSGSLKSLNIKLARLKTGTPPRIHKRSIDFSKLEEQPTEDNVQFSFNNVTKKKQNVMCHIAYTNELTKNIINKNIKKCALYSGLIEGKGPRYCPSIEDKITRFPHKERHQIFLEPEGLNTVEYYANGLSSSMPYDVQLDVIHSIEGLENAEIMRPAYAIEYDYVVSSQLYASLESKAVSNLFFAGQVNGTTGYEEAAAQGLIAGINAVKKIRNEEAFVLKRSESYIGVMIDDLISKELDEPYRMFTSRAEYRLLLRQDNADLRLREYGYNFGLISKNIYEKTKEKKDIIEEEKKRFFLITKKINDSNLTIGKYLSRPEISYKDILLLFPDDIKDYEDEINKQIEIEIKFSGYISRQEKEIEKFLHLEKINIPKNFDYSKVIGLRSEAIEKLSKFFPPNLSSASKLIGVCPADITILRIAIEKALLNKQKNEAIK